MNTQTKILIAAILLLFALTCIGILVINADVSHYPEPEAHPDCLGRPWVLLWFLDESNYCQNSGTYVLWACYDEQGNYLHFCSRCFYSPIYLPYVRNGPPQPTARPTPSPAPTMDPEFDQGYPAPPTPGPTPTYVDPWVQFCLEFPDTNWCVDPSTRPDCDNPYFCRP